MLLCPRGYPPIQQEQLGYQYYYRALVHVVGYIHYVQVYHFHFPYIRLPLGGSEVAPPPGLPHASHLSTGKARSRWTGVELPVWLSLLYSKPRPVNEGRCVSGLRGGSGVTHSISRWRSKGRKFFLLLEAVLTSLDPRPFWPREEGSRE